MSLFNFIPGIAGGQEKETLQLIKEHADMAHEVVSEFMNAFAAFEAKDYEKVRSTVDNVNCVESKADDLRRKIEAKIYSGAFLPGSRSLILNFAERIDEIADVAQDAARMLVFLDDRNVPKDILALIHGELDGGLATADMLRASVSDMGKGAEVTAAIEHLRAKEHEVDEIENKAYTLLYKSVKDPILLLLISKLITYTGNISDRCEDASDALSLVILLNKA
jgi:predicted phosphate transport protein (TIGR00153 family)